MVGVQEYYKKCYGDYKLGWSTHKNFSMHNGYYDNGNRDHFRSVMRMNEVLASEAKIIPSDTVLDVGCGVGGSTIWLAEHIGCHVVGIDITESQLIIAREEAARRNLDGLVKFFFGDFTDTGLEYGHFDIVWALESSCHASDTYMFLQEAKRLLRPGGRLVIGDGFLTTLANGKDKDIKKFLSGWAVSNPTSVNQFMGYLRKLGFLRPHLRDITPNIIPSSRRIYRVALAYYPVGMVLRCLGVRSSIQSANIVSAILQYKTLIRGLWKYCIITATR